MRVFEIPVRAVRRLLPVALLSAVACGGSVFNSSGGAGTGGGSVTAGAGGGDVGGGSTAGADTGGADTGGADTGGAPSGGQAAGGISSGGSSSAGAGDMDNTQECASNTDCVLISGSCCSCGSDPVSSYIAINSLYASQYQNRCNGVDCAGCPVSTSADNPVNYYVATCARAIGTDLPGVAIPPGHCVAVDLRATDVTACKSASDCSLRAGTGCCGGCGAGMPVAINSSKEPELEQDVCGNEPTACNDCAPLFPGYSATCSGGHCSVGIAVGSMPCTPPNPCSD
jgi:hypothetical protein